MKFILILMCLHFFSVPLLFAQNAAPAWISDDLGEYIITPMKNAPYPHPSRANGFQGRNVFFPADKHYMDNSVGILIPKGYTPADTVDFIVLFHGHNNNVAKEIPQLQLREQLAESRKNAIMILPQGPYNAADSSCGRIEDPDGLKNLVAEVAAFLREAGKTTSTKTGKVVITGHSGGYKPIAFCLDVGGLEEHITEVYLMDAAYGMLESYSKWAARGKGRLVSICTDHLLEENQAIMKNLQQAGIGPLDIMRDDDVTSTSLVKNRCTFIHTNLGHNQLNYQTRYLARFLASGSLKDRP